MPLSLNSRFCGNVYIIQCRGRLVEGDEVKSLEGALEVGVREFSRLGVCREYVSTSLALRLEIH
jgi:hypothetical protein